MMRLIKNVLRPIQARGPSISSARGYVGTDHLPYGRYSILDPSTAMTTYPDPLPVPESISRPPYVPVNFFTAPWGYHDEVEPLSTPTQREGRVGTGIDELRRVKAVARLAAEVLRLVEKEVKPGVTTAQLDELVHRWIVERGAYPSTLGYTNFPRSCTTSVNNVIAHGIPDDRPLELDDIINIDLTLYYQGYHGDTSRTFLLPNVDNQGKELVQATQEALEIGIKACGPGMPLSGIGQAISSFADKEGFSINQQFSGHGIGRSFHQQPWILHHYNTERGTMQVGDCFTIEPILVQGKNSRGFIWEDGWTMSTESGARSAQFEHQVIITENGPEVLTR